MGGPKRLPEETQDDRDLVERARRGDREAFGALVRRYQDRAFNLAYQMLRNREEALDVAQEAFARAYASLPTFKGESSFTTWLHRIVVNLGIDSLRRTQRSGTVAYDDTRATPEDGEGDLPAVDDPAAALEMRMPGTIGALEREPRRPIRPSGVFVLKTPDPSPCDARSRKFACTACGLTIYIKSRVGDPFARFTGGRGRASRCEESLWIVWWESPSPRLLSVCRAR